MPGLPDVFDGRPATKRGNLVKIASTGDQFAQQCRLHLVGSPGVVGPVLQQEVGEELRRAAVALEALGQGSADDGDSADTLDEIGEERIDAGVRRSGDVGQHARGRRHGQPGGAKRRRTAEGPS